MDIWGSQIVVYTRGVIRGAGWAGHRDSINIIGVINDRIRVRYGIRAGHRDCINIICVINDRICARYRIHVRCLDTGSMRSVSSGLSRSRIGNAWFSQDLWIILSVAPLSHRHVRPAIIGSFCLLTPWRLAVTTGKGSLVPLDKINLLSNFGSFSMASLCWFFYLFMLLVTMWFNLFISLL